MSYNPPVVISTPTVHVSGSDSNNTIFKSSSVMATCPSCKTSANTTVTTKANILNILLYCCADPLIWLIVQLVRGKDLNCCDATHTCSGCGSLIANYAAC